MAHLRRLVVERLMLYHRLLSEERERGLPATITSAEIADTLDIDPTQVRKDLAAIGLRGKGRVGFDAGEVFTGIRRALGFDQTHLAILVGAGHLGGALLAYRGFARYGLRIVAAFDTDPAKVGQEIAGCPVRPIESMDGFITRHQIRLAILATPAHVAQGVVNHLVRAGIGAIWNFAPTHLSVPSDVCLRDEHISLGFAHVAHHLAQ